jgi:hypothetical protein
MDFMPLPRRPGFETGARVDMDSIMLYHSSIARAVGAPSYPLLTARGSIINSGGNPDPNRAGLSRGDIERVMQLYPKRRAAPRRASEDASEKQLAKRWHSLTQGPRLWPPRAWCGGTAYIFYCYDSPASSMLHDELFMAALGKWSTSLYGSGLEFLPDLACTQHPCSCNTHGVMPETLRIMDAPDEVRWPTATLGYRDSSTIRADMHMPLNYILWPVCQTQFQGKEALYMAQQMGKRLRRKPRRWRNIIPRPIADLITGRVMGLIYEHQRPDAEHHVKFICRELQGFDEARATLRQLGNEEPAFQERMDISAKLDLM